MKQVADFTFTGTIVCDSFAAFARHRADRLALRLDLGACDARAAAMRVEGEPALIDMFEMALSLGPYDCIVLDVGRIDRTPPFEGRGPSSMGQGGPVGGLGDLDTGRDANKES